MIFLRICTIIIAISLILLTACSNISLYQSDYIASVAAEYSPECPPYEHCG